MSTKLFLLLHQYFYPSILSILFYAQARAKGQKVPTNMLEYIKKIIFIEIISHLRITWVSFQSFSMPVCDCVRSIIPIMCLPTISTTQCKWKNKELFSINQYLKLLGYQQRWYFFLIRLRIKLCIFIRFSGGLGFGDQRLAWAMI